MTEGNKNARMARLALAAACAVALAGVVGAGHAETAIELPVALVDPVQNAAHDTPATRFQPSPEAELEAELEAGLAPIQPDPALSTPPAGAAGSLDGDDGDDPDTRALGSGMASFNGRAFAGRATASGERFDPHGLTAAHRTLPFGSKVRVTNPRNGKSVVVRINDRGPFSGNRLIDLSRGAAEEIGIVARGHGKVDIELLLG